MERKYIITLVLGHEVPILFSSLIPHKQFLSCFCKEMIVSAGVFSVFPDKGGRQRVLVSVWGKSISLDIKSRPEDVKIIEKFLNA